MKGMTKVFSNGSAILKEPLKGYRWECVGSHLVGRPRKRWIDSVNEMTV